MWKSRWRIYFCFPARGFSAPEKIVWTHLFIRTILTTLTYFRDFLNQFPLLRWLIRAIDQSLNQVFFLVVGKNTNVSKKLKQAKILKLRDLIKTVDLNNFDLKTSVLVNSITLTICFNISSVSFLSFDSFNLETVWWYSSLVLFFSTSSSWTCFLFLAASNCPRCDCSCSRLAHGLG